jgi:hypothetical protein
LALFGFEDKEYSIGSSTALVSINDQAHAEFIEFHGKGLDYLVNELAEKDRQMIFLGIQFGEEKKGVEGEKSQLIRKSTGLATLSSVTKTLEEGLNLAISYLTEWQGLQPIVIELNKDFIGFQADIEVLKSLMAGNINEQVSNKVLFAYAERSDLYPKGHTSQDEIDELANQETKSFNEPGVQ